jgi:hypothetical protein
MKDDAEPAMLRFVRNLSNSGTEIKNMKINIAFGSFWRLHLPNLSTCDHIRTVV